MNKKTRFFIPWLFNLPSIMLFFLFSFLPILSGLYFSFTNYDGLRTPKFLGFANYIEIIQDPAFWTVFFRTTLYSLISVPLIYIVALMLALLLSKDIFGKGFFRAIIYWPAMMSFVVIGTMWKWFLGESFGIINLVFQYFGYLPIQTLSNPLFAFVAVILIMVWSRCGFFMVIFFGGLQSIPNSYYEAAKLDGANKITCFFKITYPLMKPTSFLIILLSTLETFKIYPLVLNLTSGGPGNATKFIVQYAYDMAFQSNRVGYANAVSMLLFILLAIVTLIQFSLNKKNEDYLS